jgi:hypothetical protein
MTENFGANVAKTTLNWSFPLTDYISFIVSQCYEEQQREEMCDLTLRLNKHIGHHNTRNEYTNHEIHTVAKYEAEKRRALWHNIFRIFVNYFIHIIK